MQPRIVVIEDEPEIMEMVRDLLHMAGYDVVGLIHPAEVDALDPREPPGLFLIDLMLPTMSGIELAQQLREQGYQHTPMIALSASRLMQQFAHESHLFQATLGKPFDVSVLLERVERCLNRTRVPNRR
jgi:DNA-binding response OmpR family regulator